MLQVKLIVAGSRTILDTQYIYKIINKHIEYLLNNKHLYSLDDLIIISGCAPGVDSIALKWAIDNNIKYEKYPAQWINERGIKDLSAGFKRNKKMALNSTHLLAIWDGKSPGTSHMIETMDALDKNVFIVRYSND